jgi:hypothetical protein
MGWNIRKGSILIHRGPLGWSEDTQTDSVFDLTKSIRGRVGDRILQGGECLMDIQYSTYELFRYS